MGINLRTIEQIAKSAEKLVAKETPLFGGLKSIMHTKPQAFGEIKPAELKLATLTEDVVQLSKVGIKPKGYEISAELSERLTQSPQGNALLKESYDEFWKLKGNRVLHDSVDVINKDSLIHGLSGYDKGAIKGILEEGIVSGDIRYNNKNFVCEDGETFGCADFFTSSENFSIKDYCSTYINRKVGIRQAPERAYLPKHSDNPAFASDNIAFVIDGKKLKQDSNVLLKNSTTPKEFERSNLNGIIHHFPGVENHRAVLMGVPSEYISKIIVGGKIKNLEIIEIKELLRANNLDAKIFDTQGCLL